MSFHFFHRWTRWQIVEQGNLANQHGHIRGNYLVQRRECKTCGFVQQRMTKQKL